MKKKLLVVFGTRPEAIKMVPVVNALTSAPSEFDVKVCVTGQHRQMLDQILKVSGITPDFDLNLMQAGQDLFDVTARVLVQLRGIFNIVEPDMVFVHGDTTTTFACSLAAYYSGVEVAHVEAGLRTWNIAEPYPEEFNRKVTGVIAGLHFAPTEGARENLLREGVDASRVYVTGNTVIDSLRQNLDRLQNDPGRLEAIHQELRCVLGFDFSSTDYTLITGHRRENFGSGFIEICTAIRELAVSRENHHFIYPVHLNPNVQSPVFEILSGVKNVSLIDPQDYEPFLVLLNHCKLVLTDSGGIQEEAPSLGKPVLVMRDVTERPEAVEAGTVRLVGAEARKIMQSVSELLDNDEVYKKMSGSHNPYGDGYASERILIALREHYAS